MRDDSGMLTACPGGVGGESAKFTWLRLFPPTPDKGFGGIGDWGLEIGRSGPCALLPVLPCSLYFGPGTKVQVQKTEKNRETEKTETDLSLC